MNIAIVGSRRYQNKNKIETLVDALSTKHTIVSGGCEGVDTWAVERAKSRGMNTKEITPDLENIETHYDMVQRYYARNKKVVQESDCVFAFVAPDRKGGTENTIQWCKKLNVEVFIYE